MHEADQRRRLHQGLRCEAGRKKQQDQRSAHERLHKSDPTEIDAEGGETVETKEELRFPGREPSLL
jgi:hypothetical protein